MSPEQVNGELKYARGLWQKWQPTSEEEALWREKLRPFAQPIMRGAIGSHKAGTRYTTPTLSSILSDARARTENMAASSAVEERKRPETWVEQLRRMHKIPSDASDGDVLVWWHITEVERSREVYRASHSLRFTELRRAFRRDWQAARLPNGHRAECRVFGNSAECEGFWKMQKETVAA